MGDDISSVSFSFAEQSPGQREGARIDAKDICYSVLVNGKMKRILKSASFSVDAGEMCAVMGSSGSGKSTVLDLLAARTLVGTWSGTVLIDGCPRSSLFRRETAYVLQSDLHISTLTVEETIMYSAWVKLGEGTSLKERQRRVDLLLDLMGLNAVRSKYVGDGMSRGISGGELKRLSIAVEIVALPRLIFLDEPTSGLDSAIAWEVMIMVRNLVSSTLKDRTCIATIHQPSKEIFNLFDKLILLAAGRVIFFGAAADAETHFAQPELGYKLNGHKNPAEFILQIACAQCLPENLPVPRQPEDLEILYKNSPYFRPTKMSPRNPKSLCTNDDIYDTHSSTLHVTHWMTQAQMLIERSWVAKSREIVELRGQVYRYATMGILSGMVFYGKGNLDAPFYNNGKLTSDASAVIAFLFSFSTFTMMLNNQSVAYFFSRLQLYKRERASNAYSPLPYWVSQLVTMLPFHFALHFMCAMIAYWTVQLNTNAGVFFYFLFVTFLGNLIAFISAMGLAAHAKTEVFALAVFPAQFLFLTVLSGFVVTLDDLPVYWRWLTYVNYSRFIFEGLMVNEWQQYDTDDQSGADQDGYGDVLQDFDFTAYNKMSTVGISFLFIGVSSLVFYYGLLPPKSVLLKVDNAADVVSVLSANGSTVSSLSNGSGTRKVKIVVKSVARTDLHANLMDSNEGGDHLEESMVVEDPLLVHSPPRGVASFQASTGAIHRARGCRLVFRDVHYTVADKADSTKQITLLKGVTGRAMPGEMVALMGASGAGKSTLLDVLSQRKPTGTITGEITYNGAAEMTSFAYVMQDNVHMGILTVRESLEYAAELRLNELMSSEAKARRVQKIIDMLGLQEVANTILGTSDIRGVSGGQLKRVSIGVEIVNLPNLMFLDEPTTGLDSSISLEVMSAVRNLANQNRTVICTIHQPSEDTFALFDTLLLLAEGRVIYFGPTASVVDFFVQSPYQFVCNVGANPADFVVSVAGSFLHALDGRTISGGELAAYYSTSDRAQSAAVMHHDTPGASIASSEEISASSASPPEPEQDLPLPLQTGLWQQVRVLTHRRLQLIRKQPRLVIAPIVRELLVGLLHGSIYWQLDTGDDCGSSCYRDRLSVIYYALMLMLIGHTDCMSTVLDERLMFYRERGAKAYSSFAYWVSIWIVQIPFPIFSVLVYSAVLYPMAGLRTGGLRFFTFFFFMLLTNYIGKLSSYFIACISENAQVSLCYFPVMFMFNTFYAGFLVYIPSLPDWQGSWLPYLSFYRFAFQGLVLNEFQHNDDLPEAHDYINQLGFDFISVGGCAGVLLLFVAVFAAIFYLALRFVDFEER